MHNETTKALYEMFPDEDKNDFYNAYIYLKHLDHFVYHAKQSAGLPSVKPDTPIDPGVDEMIQASVYRVAEKSGDRDTSVYHMKIVKLVDAIQLVTQKKDVNLKTPETVVPYKQAKDIILNNPDSIALGECVCRSTAENPCLKKEEREVCMYIGDPHASFMAENNEKFRKISQEKAVEVLNFAHEKGFVHTAEFKAEMGRKFVAICNCCSCCCLGIQMWNVMGGAIPFLAPSGYLAEIDDTCIGCGDCVDICKFNAIQLNDQSMAVMNNDACMGCGICEDKCETGSIALKLDPSKGEPLDLKKLLNEKV